MEHSKITTEAALIEFLKLHDIQAIPANKANPGHLCWWEKEGIRDRWIRQGDKHYFDLALIEGYFFLYVTERGFRLYVHDLQNDWYNLVRIWEVNLPLDVIVQDLKEIIHSNDIYSLDSYVWFWVRKTQFDQEWKRTSDDIEIEQISPELKERIFEFHEGLIEFPKKVKELKKAISDLLTLFTQDDVRTPINCLIMQRYFLPYKYEHWNIPDDFKIILDQIGISFENNQIPNRKAIDSLLQKAKVMHY